jgi:hypothetical protein
MAQLKKTTAIACAEEEEEEEEEDERVERTVAWDRGLGIRSGGAWRPTM